MARYMKFEFLANELLLDIFEYLPSVHLLRSFYNLNLRFNNLLFVHFRSFSLDFRSVSQYDFNLICREYLPSITDHIISLCLSNNDDTPQQIELFLEHNLNIRQFYSLKSLSLYELCSNEIMNKIMFEWKYLPNLTHLTLAGCYLRFNQINTQQLIDNIWSLPKLIYCYLNINFGEFNVLIPRVMSSSLKYLFIWGIEHNQHEINALFKQTPYLQNFSILFNYNDEIEQSISSIIKLKLCLSRIEENILIKFFENTPNLNHLIIDICSSTNEILNGYQWENIIRNYLPNLKLFQFRMEFQYKNINNLLNSFKTSFWIEEHNWFIRCHWNSNLIYLYSLPYIFKEFYFDSSMQFKSTCPNDDNYLYYNHVKELKYNMSSVLSPIQFLNINHLSIDFPINMNFWSIIPKLDQITSLNVSINNSNVDQSQFQYLINKIPHLDSLSFNSCTSILIFELINVSIRRLDLQRYNQYFNDEQCRSLIGIQCEILFIKIKNRHISIDLIRNMMNLRMLNIECEDDNFEETKQDELIIWLKEHLPLTCIVTRDFIFHSDIRIWIR